MNLASAPPTQEQILTLEEVPHEIILRCWEDPEFLTELKESPHKLLAHIGMDVDVTAEIRVMENTPSVVHWVIPCCPQELRELDPQTLTPDKW